MTLSEKIEIPLLPLSLFLCPGERVQLHIFEPRYKQLFAELEEGDSLFGIPYTVGKLNHGLGSRCRLVKVVKRYTSGESDVLIECDGLFKLEDFQSMKEDKLYPFGQVSLLRAIASETISPEVMLAYEAFCKELEGSDLHFHTVSSDSTLTVLASLNLLSEEKHNFVQLPSPERRDNYLLGIIKQLTSLVSQEKVTEQGFYLS